MVTHDLAYADLIFDGYVAPSFLQVKGAKDVGVEFFSLSKSYSMPGWRVGFAVGNQKMIAALTRLKSYFDYGVFQPIQIASIIALNEENACVAGDHRGIPEKKGRPLPGPHAVRVARARAEGDHVRLGADPRTVRAMGSVEFSKLLLQEAKVASSPGIGFGEYGEGYVRFALIENEHRIKQAVKGIRSALAEKKAMIRVGIIGLGTVGRGTYRILREHRALIAQKTGLDIALAGAAEIDAERRKRPCRRRTPAFFAARSELIDDPAIDIIVELIGGTGYAFDLITAALRKGKWVVTANKALLAEKGNEIFDLAAEDGCEIGFEASVCGGIPVIRAIRDGLVGNRIDYLLGILNGTSNYILTQDERRRRLFRPSPRGRAAGRFCGKRPDPRRRGPRRRPQALHTGASRLRLPPFHGRYRKGRHLRDRTHRHRLREGAGLQDQAAGGRERRRRGNRGEGDAGNAARNAPHEQRKRRLQRGLCPGRPGRPQPVLREGRRSGPDGQRGGERYCRYGGKDKRAARQAGHALLGREKEG